MNLFMISKRSFHKKKNHKHNWSRRIFFLKSQDKAINKLLMHSLPSLSFVFVKQKKNTQVHISEYKKTIMKYQ